MGDLLMMNQAGFMPGPQARRGPELFACEVYPVIRELGENPVQVEAAATV